MDLVHSLAEACARSHDPFALALVDGRVVDRRPVLEGLAALRDADRALLDLRRAVAEDLTPMPDDELVATVADYLTAVERLALPALDGTAEATLRRRQRVVMAAMARLPERERSPLLRGPEPSARQDIAILRRYCRAVELALPYRPGLPAAERVAGLVAGVKAAAGAFILAMLNGQCRAAAKRLLRNPTSWWSRAGTAVRLGAKAQSALGLAPMSSLAGTRPCAWLSRRPHVRAKSRACAGLQSSWSVHLRVGLGT